MAFKASDISVLAYANNFTLWHYKTTDDSIDTTGYFDNASDMLRAGDLMIVSLDLEGEPKTKFYIVSRSDGGKVSVTGYS